MTKGWDTVPEFGLTKLTAGLRAQLRARSWPRDVRAASVGLLATLGAAVEAEARRRRRRTAETTEHQRTTDSARSGKTNQQTEDTQNASGKNSADGGKQSRDNSNGGETASTDGGKHGGRHHRSESDVQTNQEATDPNLLEVSSGDDISASVNQLDGTAIARSTSGTAISGPDGAVIEAGDQSSDGGQPFEPVS